LSPTVLIPPLSPDQIPGLSLWLDAAQGVRQDGAVALVGSSAQTLTRPSPTLPSTAISVSLWALTAGPISAFDGVLGTPTGGSWSDGLAIYWSASNRISGYIGSYAAAALQGPVVTPPSWNHVTLTWDGTVSRLYVNGTMSSSAWSTPLQHGTLRVGGLPGSGFFTGRVDSAGVWSRALTSTEVGWLFNGGSGRVFQEVQANTMGLPTGLVSWWELDEPTGPRLDSLGANPLTPSNNPTLGAGVANSAADNGAGVSRWLDRSGNNRNGTQTDLSKRPVHGSTALGTRPAILADGIDDELALPSATLSTTDFTAFSVFRSSAALEQTILGNDNGQAGGFALIASTLVGGQGRLAFRIGGTPGFSLTGNSQSNDGLPHIGVVRKSGSQYQLFLDGRLEGAATSAIALDQTTAASVFGRANRLQGACGSIGLHGRALTNLELNGLTSFLGSLHGIPVGQI
jgi:hypothetical protein